MSIQQNNNAQLDDNVQESLPSKKHRARNFYRKRPGNDRQNQELGEDENRPPNDDDTQQSNNSDEHNNHGDDNVNNSRGRAPRGGFRRGRGRGRFARSIPYMNNYRQVYSPYTDYVNGQQGYFDGYYGAAYYGVSDLLEQEGFNGYPVRGNRGFRNGRGGRGGRRGRKTKTENTDTNTNNDEQEGETATITTTTTNTVNNENTNKRRQRRQRRQTNDNDVGTEQQTDEAVTDDQQQNEDNKGSVQQQRKRSNRRRRRNTNPSQSGPETEEHNKLGQTKKPKDDETIVKDVLRNIVNKVVRRSAPRNRQRSRANTKEPNENQQPTDVEKSQTRNVRRGGRGQRGGRQNNGYFIEQGYYDPYAMTPYYYGGYYGYGNQVYGGGGGGRGRNRGGRGRGRFRQRKGGDNKENQPQDNSEEKQIEESKTIDDNSQSKATISEQVNQLSS